MGQTLPEGKAGIITLVAHADTPGVKEALSGVFVCSVAPVDGHGVKALKQGLIEASKPGGRQCVVGNSLIDPNAGSSRCGTRPWSGGVAGKRCHFPAGRASSQAGGFRTRKPAPSGGAAFPVRPGWIRICPAFQPA
jgi:hypothetical protein